MTNVNCRIFNLEKQSHFKIFSKKRPKQNRLCWSHKEKSTNFYTFKHFGPVFSSVTLLTATLDIVTFYDQARYQRGMLKFSVIRCWTCLSVKIYDIVGVAWLHVPIFTVFTCLLPTTMFWSSLHIKLSYHRYIKVLARLRGTVLRGQKPQWYYHSNVVAYNPITAVWREWCERHLAGSC